MNALNRFLQFSPILMRRLMTFSRYEQNVEKIMAIDKIIIHPKYNWQQALNRDMALLHLRRPVMLTNEIHPICLPNKAVARL